MEKTDLYVLDAEMLEIIRRLMSGYYDGGRARRRRMPWLG